MRERLQKILSGRGVASRRRAEEMIQEGRVLVNGSRAVLGDTADPDEDRILVDGQPLPQQQGYVYLMLNKPRGFVTTLSEERTLPSWWRTAGCGYIRWAVWTWIPRACCSLPTTVRLPTP